MQLADDLRGAVEGGKYKAGQRLPTVRELAEQYEVSRNTIQRALDTLKADGVVVSRPPLGIFVSSGEDDDGASHSQEFIEIMQLLDEMQANLRSVSDRLDAIEQVVAHRPQRPR